MNVFLYITTVLIWGSTWLAIEFQLGEVAVLASLVYRWTIAAALMWSFCFLRGLSMKFAAKDHAYIALMAMCVFGFNYLLIYWAQQYLTSAMTSIAFSTMVLVNIINARIFFSQAVTPLIWLGGLFGVSGIVALFWLDIRSFDLDSASLKGLGLALLGTLLASFGNMISIHNSRLNLPIMQVNAWGMLYGALLMALVALILDVPFTVTTSTSYWLSLIYLSVFGSVIAFACYFALLKRIDPSKASYTSVLFPVVAVVLSTIFEDFVWTAYTVIGFLLVGLGNLVMLTPPKVFRNLLRKPL